MDLEQLFLTRQSTREFDGSFVTDEDLEHICRLAALAPSAINAQPWKLYAVSGEKARAFTQYIQPGGANAWASACGAYIAIEAREPFAVQRGERKVTNAPFIDIDIGILTAHLVLAAEANGIQSCIVGLRDEKGIAAFLGRPQGTRFPLVIALGHRAEGYAVREKNRRDFADNYQLIK